MGHHHAALKWLLSFREPEGQVARWIQQLQEYDFDIQHCPRNRHANADTLSQRPCWEDACKHCRKQEEMLKKFPVGWYELQLHLFLPQALLSGGICLYCAGGCRDWSNPPSQGGEL